MKRALWVLALLSLAGLPFACTSTTGADGAGGGTSVSSDECNPVTSAGCVGAGTDCDIDFGSGFFVCYAPPNTVAVCGECSDDGSTCSAGLTCLLPAGAPTPSCYRYCCTNTDCGPGGVCDSALLDGSLPVDDPRDTVGVCVTSTSVTTQAPACSPPAIAPSGGSCVGGYLSDGGTYDSGSPDAGSSDAGSSDAGPSDAGSSDAGSSDAG
jgi:hypothetical protein